MRIVAWNCRMALHRKIDALMALRPDLAVIPEAGAPERLVERVPALAEASLVWVGKNPNKGLLLAGFGTTLLDFDRNRCDDSLHWIAPVAVRGLPGLEGPLHLLGVWAQNASEGNRRKDNPGYVQQALGRYRRFLRSAPSVVAGDFNNHVQWDRPGWKMNHANEIRSLARLGLVSAYHVSRGIEAGNESEPTLYWRSRTYHIDYVFMPEEWTKGSFDLTVGRYEDWIGSGLSDHVPLVLEVTQRENRGLQRQS